MYRKTSDCFKFLEDAQQEASAWNQPTVLSSEAETQESLISRLRRDRTRGCSHRSRPACSSTRKLDVLARPFVLQGSPTAFHEGGGKTA